MRAIESFEIESGELGITVSVICFECSDGFSDQWEGTDKHQGGVTIANPEADRNSYKYFIPRQYTLADLAADYAKQGRENPSAAAYQSLQDQLQRDIYACDYGFKVSVSVCGIELVSDTVIGCGFDHSIYDTEDLITVARGVWDEYDITADVLELAKKAASDILASVPALTKLTKGKEMKL